MMKLLANFLFVFLCLLIFGFISYIYMIWTTYWQRIAKLLHDKEHFFRSDKYLDMFSKRNNSYKDENDLKHMEFELIHNLESLLKKRNKYENPYKVKYTGKRRSLSNNSPESIICDAKKNVHIKTFLQGDAFFKEQQLDQFFFQENIFENQVFNTCAVVTNAYANLGSNQGSFIDSHDFVIRFNDAVTEDYAKDVGSKISLRIVNNQVVYKPQYNFIDSETTLYSQSPNLVWDCSNYQINLSEWYKSYSRLFFERFFSKRLMKPEDSDYLLHPSSVWSIWKWLQSYFEISLPLNPPSSGFIGFMFAIKHCHTLHMFKFLPMGKQPRCHYYDKRKTVDCSTDVWHPLPAEKLMALKLSTGNRQEMFVDGYITVSGFPSYNCNEE